MPRIPASPTFRLSPPTCGTAPASRPAAASEACHAAPDLPEAHYAYGQAWLAQGEPARAERAFAAAIKLKPNWADAWINYGLCRYRRGRIDEAKTAMRQALRSAPGHAIAAANLGALMRISGEAAPAEALLRATLAREPANVGARLNLVADLLQEERPDEALALLAASDLPADDPRALRHWRLQQSLALLQSGGPMRPRLCWRRWRRRTDSAGTRAAMALAEDAAGAGRRRRGRRTQ